MKKAILGLSIIAVTTLFFTSCKKNYTCVCSLNGTVIEKHELGKQTRSDAKAACDAFVAGLGVIYKCEID